MRREALWCGCAGLAALAICAAGLEQAPARAAAGYLAACVFWLGLSLGAMGLLLVLALVGGCWGGALRPALRSAAAALWLMPLLFLPLAAGPQPLYPWLQADALAHDATLRQQTLYLNQPGLLLRAALCFGVWLWLSRRLRAGTVSRTIAASGSLLLLVSVSVFAVDWVMSLQPQFSSSSFGLVLGLSQLLGAAALALLVGAGRLAPRAATDFGGLLLALVLAWGYVEFMTYLTVWTADLPTETVWYLPRTQTSWKWLALAMLLLQTVLPFFLLLSDRFRRGRGLRWLALGILAGNAVEVSWRGLPALHPQGLRYGLYELAALIGVGGLWLALFLRRLRPEAGHA